MSIDPGLQWRLIGAGGFVQHAFGLLPRAVRNLRKLRVKSAEAADARLAAMFAGEVEGIACARCGLTAHEMIQAQALALREGMDSALPHVICLERPLTLQSQRRGRRPRVVVDRLKETEHLPAYGLARDTVVQGMHALAAERGYVPRIA